MSALLDLGLTRTPARRRPKFPVPAATVARGQWPLNGAINVALFAGLGGACDGLEAAGLPIHLAVNHDPIAIAAHRKRHPHTMHLQSDVFEVDPRQVTHGRPIGVLWASPDCRDFSRAKGGAPVSPRVRSLPWVVCRWAGQGKPLVIFGENVSEIRTWGPLIALRDKETGRVIRRDGSVAMPGERVARQDQQLVRDPDRRGLTFQAWVRHLERLGYRVEHRDLVAADYGVPTTRKRFFMIARRDGKPIVWPAPTHAPRDKAAALGLKPWVSAGSIIDWSIPMRSIFGRKKSLAEATLRRIARGVVKFVLDCANPFIIPVTHGGDDRVHDIEHPLRTQTTAHRGEFALIAPALVGVGGRAGQSPPCDAGEPLRVVTTKGDRALVAAHLTKFRENSIGVDLAEPLPTYTASSFIKRPGGAPPLGVVGGAMVQTGYGERPGQTPRALDPAEPFGTMVAGGSKTGIVGAFLQRYYGERRDGEVRAAELDEPLPTQSTSNRFGLTAGWMLQNNTGENGHHPDKPVSTIVAKGCTQAVGAAHLIKLRGTCRDGQAADAPLATITASGTHFGLCASSLMKYYGAGGQDQGCAEPLDTVTAKARFGIVTCEIEGETYALADILMRMLVPDEGAAAHAFRRGSLPTEVEIDGKVVKLTQEQRMRLVGNSVPPPMAEVISLANSVLTLFAPGIAAE